MSRDGRMDGAGEPGSNLNPAEQAEPRRSAAGVGKILALILGVGALLWLGRIAGGRLPDFVDWVNAQGIWAPVIFITAYAIATVAFVPGSLLTLAAGAVFGIVRGSAFVFVGAVIGSTLALLVSRHLARPFIERRIAGDRRFEKIDRAIERDGLKIVLLLRLSPVLPYNLLNYALGLTRVSLRDYLLASVGMLPGTILFVYSGKVAGDVAALAGGAEIERGASYYALLVVGLLATAAATVWITRIARRAMEEEPAETVDSSTGDGR